ncbi:glutaminyl-peptide cyclotransferase [Aequoribacter sp.]|jgi:glutamine cyclotransferase|uniref:glutaminyl-peptide cyclotransferase n=1 Tax=Aequoribacter sp. TaxID=2847771 RepID=UPI003F69BBF3
MKLILRFWVLLFFAPYITIAQPVTQLSFQIVDKQSQDRDAFVQGLAFDQSHLYLGTGGYGSSYVAKINPSTGNTIVQESLPARYFGEGVTVLGNVLYQLTWRSGTGFVRDRETLQVIEQFRIIGEAWGITNDGTNLIISNGSDSLTFYTPEGIKPIRSITVTEEGRRIKRLNELEYIDGLVWANIWYEDRVVVINPQSGEVVASLNLEGLLPRKERLPNTDVLNGIGYDPTKDSVWFTGKRWPWRYQLEILPERPKFLPTEP